VDLRELAVRVISIIAGWVLSYVLWPPLEPDPQAAPVAQDGAIGLESRPHLRMSA